MNNSSLTEAPWNKSPICDRKPSAASLTKHLSGKLNREMLARDASFQSDDSSRCSSIESMLELRKADPEQVLIGLGFGPPHSSKMTSRIPQRFLHPSKLLSNVHVNKFLEQFAEVPSMEHRFHSLPNSPARLRTQTS